METKEELRKRLTSIQYQVTQEAGTERAFTGNSYDDNNHKKVNFDHKIHSTGKYDKFYEQGVYQCIVCHQDLFGSDNKYDSGCGWPAFNDGE